MRRLSSTKGNAGYRKPSWLCNPSVGSGWGTDEAWPKEAFPDAERACFLKSVTICAFEAEISGRCHNAGGRQIAIPRTQVLEVPVSVKEG